MKINLSKNGIRILLLTINSFWAIALLSMIIILPAPRIRLAEIRSRIDASQSLEDLHQRAEHTINILQLQEKAFVLMNGLLKALLVYGVVLAIVNITTVCFLTNEKINL